MSTLLDESALSTLTDEEREAMGGDEYSEEAKEAIARIAADAAGDDDDDDKDNEATPAAEPEAVKDPEPDPEPAQKPVEPDTQQATSPPVVASAPKYADGLPSDYADKLASIEARREKIEAEFDEGQIDLVQHRKSMAELGRDRDELLIAKARAETLQAINETNSRNAHAAFERAFVERVRNDGVDYTQQRNQRLFNSMLADIAEVSPGKSEAWYWEQAHASVMRARGVAVPAKADAVQTAVAARKTTVANAPKTLAQVPGADGPGDVGGEFADVDALSGLALEDAIRRMTPEQRIKYLRG